MKKFLQKIQEDAKTQKPVVMAFGRMNPPTIGHEKLVNRVQEIAKDYNAPHHIIISHSVDAKKNPLSADRKLTHAKRFFPGANIEVANKETPTFLQHAARLNAMGHDHLVMVAGSDRIDEYEKKLKEYNGTKDKNPKALYNFKKIEVKSAGHRDPDAEGAEGMSASKMREHAKNNDFTSFKRGVPSHVPERHAKELFKDVQAGMGIHESVNRGLFKAVFVSGGPGSGKDIIVREAISEHRAVEMNPITAATLLNDKHKLYGASRDLRREAIRNRSPLIINGTTNESDNILSIREELEELGYETMMIFVNTSDESSKKRNQGHERMMTESVRFDRWQATQLVAESFNREFIKYLEFDNSIDLNEATDFEVSEKEEDISIIYEMTNWFFDIEVQNETAEQWLHLNKKVNVNKLFEQVYEKNSKTVYAKKSRCTCSSGGKKLFDNICPSCQLVRNQGKQDSVKDGDVASNSSYTFRTYEGYEPTIKIRPEPREPNFQQDRDKQKAKKTNIDKSEIGRVMKTAGVGPEYDTRGSGTVYPMSGLGQTYREQKDNKYTNAAEVKNKSFSKFRQESMDSPSVDMGVTGGEYGPSKKEPMETLNKIETTLKKKLKK
jgi:predicted kinase